MFSDLIHGMGMRLGAVCSVRMIADVYYILLYSRLTPAAIVLIVFGIVAGVFDIVRDANSCSCW